MKRVNFKQAKRLNLAGYDAGADMYYREDGNRIASHFYNWNDGDRRVYSAPTLHVVTDWLRGKGLHVYVRCDTGYWCYDIYDLINEKCVAYSSCIYPDHDTALSAAIDQALTTLTEKQSK